MYRTINTFGSQNTVALNDPLTYLVNPGLGASFITGIDSKMQGKGSKAYRDFFSDRCAVNFDGICRVAVSDRERGAPVNDGDYTSIVYDNLSSGDLLLKDIAVKKYLRGVNSACKPTLSTYNSLNPTSPYVSSFNNCTKSFGITNGSDSVVDKNTLDKDEVMNRILDRPEIAPVVLINIYQNLVLNKQLETIKGTRLYDFYMSNRFKMLNDRYGNK